MKLLTRAGCHLCDDARDVVARVCAAASVTWEVKDVDADPELALRYTDHVPVVFVDETLLSYWFVDADQLHGALVDLPQ